MKKGQCKYCRKKFPLEELIIVPAGKFCGRGHMIEYAMANPTRLAKKGRQIQRSETKKAKDKLKSRSDWMKEVQTVFNRFIRLRDKDEPCICCGRPATDEIQWHAGHFLTTGARPEHRFNENNCFKQTSYCNNYLSGNVAEYRKRLIEKIGLATVEAMESDHDPKKYTIEDLKELKRYYANKCRELSR